MTNRQNVEMNNLLLLNKLIDLGLMNRSKLFYIFPSLSSKTSYGILNTLIHYGYIRKYNLREIGYGRGKLNNTLTLYGITRKGIEYLYLENKNEKTRITK